ncbi:hypothetical protein HispidOSU_003760, partial [Sigmodon hispidus]
MDDRTDQLLMKRDSSFRSAFGPLPSMWTMVQSVVPKAAQPTYAWLGAQMTERLLEALSLHSPEATSTAAFG